MAIPGQQRQLLLDPGAGRPRLPKLLFGFIGPCHIRFEQRRSAEQILGVRAGRHQVRKSVQKSQDHFQIRGLWRGVHG
jgi:hypothetical protein